MPKAILKDLNAAPELYHVDYVRDRDGQFRWKLVSTANGKIVATVGEGYMRRSHCMRMVNQIFAIDQIQLARNNLGQALMSLDRKEQKQFINDALNVLTAVRERVRVRKTKPANSGDGAR